VTEKDFRQLALSMSEAIEGAHMDHPDFRVRKKIFATLRHPAKGWGMVRLTPEQQHYFSKAEPAVFVPVEGGWGRRGATSVKLKAASKKTLAKAINAAWRNTAPRKLVEQFPDHSGAL
jgi:hypothetical protein